MLLNGNWGYYPYFSYEGFLLMVFLTLFIEAFLFYWAFRGEKRMAEYLCAILALNLVSGLVGFIILVGLQ